MYKKKFKRYSTWVTKFKSVLSYMNTVLHTIHHHKKGFPSIPPDSMKKAKWGKKVLFFFWKNLIIKKSTFFELMKIHTLPFIFMFVKNYKNEKAVHYFFHTHSWMSAIFFYKVQRAIFIPNIIHNVLFCFISVGTRHWQ